MFMSLLNFKLCFWLVGFKRQAHKKKQLKTMANTIKTPYKCFGSEKIWSFHREEKNADILYTFWWYVPSLEATCHVYIQFEIDKNVENIWTSRKTNKSIILSTKNNEKGPQGLYQFQRTNEWVWENERENRLMYETHMQIINI